MPLVDSGISLREALFESIDKRLGCTGVTDATGRLVGVITDGDLKRILIRDPGALDSPVGGLRTGDPRTTKAHMP